jgi:glycosyltransferase involved in cell wall biosynthesis
LRVGHFAAALARAGHELFVAVAHNGSSASEAHHAGASEWSLAGARVAVQDYPEQAFDDGSAAAAVRAFAPDCVVGVTTLGASLACRLGIDAPLWADVFGDCMAEAQAKAVVHGSDAGLLRFWSVLQPVLEHADRFSAVSRPQADALVGQLGLAGRLGARNAGADLVSVIPCAAEAPHAVVTRGAGAAVFDGESSGKAASASGAADAPARVLAMSDQVAGVIRGSVVPGDAFVVLWSGSFNTWCDVATLFEGLERAMRADSSIHFVATGGAIPGHDERTLGELERRVRASSLGGRFHLLGWVEPDVVEACTAAADIGVVVERDLYERRFGSENRAVQWMARGVPCITTGRSELGRCLVARGMALGCRPGDAGSLAEALRAAAADRARVRAMGEACRAYCAEFFNFERTAAPLLEWCRSPARAADHGCLRAVSVGLLSEPKAMVRVLEGYLDELHLAQVGYRSLRWLGRRCLRSLSRLSGRARR